jgi:hypothetical protein
VRVYLIQSVFAGLLCAQEGALGRYGQGLQEMPVDNDSAAAGTKLSRLDVQPLGSPNQIEFCAFEGIGDILARTREELKLSAVAGLLDHLTVETSGDVVRSWWSHTVDVFARRQAYSRTAPASKFWKLGPIVVPPILLLADSTFGLALPKFFPAFIGGSLGFLGPELSVAVRTGIFEARIRRAFAGRLSVRTTNIVM